MGKKQAKGNLLPFSLVEQAASGDIEAIDRVLKHYAGYIRTLAASGALDLVRRWLSGAPLEETGTEPSE